MKEKQSLTEKLKQAEQTVSELQQQLDAAIRQLESFDPNAGELEHAIDQQIKLQARRDILQKRLDIAIDTANKLRDNVLIEKAEIMRAQVKELNAELEKARENARAILMKNIRGGELNPYETASINGVIEIFKTVAPLREKQEFLSARHREMEEAAANAKRRRVAAEHKERIQMQSDVFEGKI